jgi:hypothetical protein
LPTAAVGYGVHKASNAIKSISSPKIPDTAAISSKSKDMLKHMSEMYDEAGKGADKVVNKLQKTEGFFSKFYNTVKNTTTGIIKTVGEKTSTAVSSVRSGVDKIYQPVKGALTSLTDKAGTALKGLGKRGGIDASGVTKAIASKSGAAVTATKSVLKGVASNLGGVISAGIATHEAAGLAGEGDYLGAAKALLKGGFTFAGGVAGGAVGTFVAPGAGTVAGSIGGSLAAEQFANWGFRCKTKST